MSAPRSAAPDAPSRVRREMEPERDAGEGFGADIVTSMEPLRISSAGSGWLHYSQSLLPTA
jgi:hypothetical protein